MTTERELKMLANVDLVIPDLADVYPGVSTASLSDMKRLVASYYDTPSLSLARWGVTLRCRTEGNEGTEGPEGTAAIWTVKFPASSSKSTLSRRELNFSGTPTELPNEVADLVKAYSRHERLDVVATVNTERTETELLADGQRVAVLSDDLVSGNGGENVPVSFREIELELAPETTDNSLLRAAGKRLKKAGCRVEEPVLPKVIRVLGTQAQAPADVEVNEVGRQATVGELVRFVLSSSVDQLIRRDPGVRLEDPEDLHQFRVATRRLRSDLGTLAPLLDPGWMAPLRDELRWVGAAAGVVRDADVLGARLKVRFAELTSSDEAGSADAAAAGHLLDRLNLDRTRANTELRADMSSDRYVALIEALISAAREPQFVDDPPRLERDRARIVVGAMAAKRWRRLHRAARDLQPESPDHELHNVRILAKRCRYAAEVAARVAGRDARRFATAVASVQEVLGDHQDTVVAEAWLRAAAEDLPEVGVFAGIVIARERAERVGHRDEFFASVWPAASRPSLRAWFDER